MPSAAATDFWFYGEQGSYTTEIDVVEMTPKMGSGTNIYGPAKAIWESVHLWAYPGHPYSGTEYNLGYEPGTYFTPPWAVDADYHTFGVDWNANTITWYVDGVQRRQVQNNGYWVIPMPLIFDIEIQPDWFGLPADCDLPATAYVDYVPRLDQIEQPNSNANGNIKTNGNAHSNSNADRHSDSDSNTECYADTYPDTCSERDGDSHSEANSDADSNSDAACNSNEYADPNADRNGNAIANSNSAPFGDDRSVSGEWSLSNHLHRQK